MTDVNEFYHGPVQHFTPSAEHAATIERLNDSDDELERAYGEVYSAGCFVIEQGEMPGGFSAVVGSLDAYALLEFRLGRDIEQDELSIGDLMALGAVPGGGNSREGAVRNALGAFLEIQQRPKDRDGLDQYRTYEEAGYRIEVFMPANRSHANEWTVRFYEAGAEERGQQPIREIKIPMETAPVHFIDPNDIAALDLAITQLLHELDS